MKKRALFCLSIILASSLTFSNIVLANNTLNSQNSIRIENKVITLTGTVVSKATNDGTGYILNTNDGSYAVIGPNAKAISGYANTDKKVVVTGNPAEGVKILVMTSFTEYVQPVAAAPTVQAIAATPAKGIKIENKVITLTGTVVSKATNDGVGYTLNTNDGSYAIIGPNAKAISGYANTDKKVVVTGSPAEGVKIIVMTSFTEYLQPVTAAPTKGIKIENKIITLTGTVVSKATNDGAGYTLNTNDGSYAIIGPNAKSISGYANTDKKIVVTGNPAEGVKILVMTSFTEYVQPVTAAPTIQPVTATPTKAIKIENKIITLTGTVISKATNDGVGYILNTNDGSYAIIGPNAKAISSYANTDKKVVVTGSPSEGVKILVMTSFKEYVK